MGMDKWRRDKMVTGREIKAAGEGQLQVDSIVWLWPQVGGVCGFGQERQLVCCFILCRVMDYGDYLTGIKYCMGSVKYSR